MILITDALGVLGSSIAFRLSKREDVVVADENLDALAEKYPEEKVKKVFFSFSESRTWEAALMGIETLILTLPSNNVNKKDIEEFIIRAKEMGVSNIIMSSVYGIDHDILSVHKFCEDRIRKSGISFVIVRPSMFMQKFIVSHKKEIIEESQISVPVANNTVAMIDVNDAALFIESVLNTINLHLGRTYEITGSEILSYKELTAIMSGVYEKEITLKEIGLLKFRKRAKSSEIRTHYNFLSSLYAIITTAKTEKHIHDFIKYTKCEPKTFLDFLKENKELLI